jgi:hypothetical protein
MNHAFKDVMAFLNWTKVAIVYEEDYGKTWFSYEYSSSSSSPPPSLARQPYVVPGLLQKLPPFFPI